MVDNLWWERYDKLLGEQGRTSGRWRMYHCPLHEDRNPSFAVNQAGFWRCFAGCGEGRYVDLCRALDRRPDLPPRTNGKEHLPRQDNSRDMDKLRDEWAALVKGGLRHPMRAEKWAVYGVRNPELLDRYRLGFGPHYMGGRYARLLVPLYRQGVLWGIKARRMQEQDQGPTWVAVPGSRNVIWGADQVPPRPPVLYICEAPGDALVLMDRWSDVWAVAPAMGSASGRDELVELVLRLNPERVVIAYDNDGGGTPDARALILHIHKALRRRHVPLDRLPRLPDMPDGYSLWRHYLAHHARRYPPVPTPPGFTLYEALSGLAPTELFDWTGHAPGTDLRSLFQTG